MLVAMASMMVSMVTWCLLRAVAMKTTVFVCTDVMRMMLCVLSDLRCKLMTNCQSYIHPNKGLCMLLNKKCCFVMIWWNCHWGPFRKHLWGGIFLTLTSEIWIRPIKDWQNLGALF